MNKFAKYVPEEDKKKQREFIGIDLENMGGGSIDDLFLGITFHDELPESYDDEFLKKSNLTEVPVGQMTENGFEEYYTLAGPFPVEEYVTSELIAGASHGYMEHFTEPDENGVTYCNNNGGPIAVFVPSGKTYTHEFIDGVLTEGYWTTMRWGLPPLNDGTKLRVGYFTKIIKSEYLDTQIIEFRGSTGSIQCNHSFEEYKELCGPGSGPVPRKQILIFISDADVETCHYPAPTGYEGTRYSGSFKIYFTIKKDGTDTAYEINYSRTALTINKMTK